jgi:hypothetical protein
MSLAFNQYFKAGAPFITRSISTPKACLSTTAQIHSKSHDNNHSNCVFSSLFIYELCLSSSHSTNHFIAPSVNFSLSISENQ